MLIPVIMIPVFTFALFLLTWQGGLHTSIEKKFLPLLFALPVVVSFVVVSIVVIVRLCRKLPVRMLLQVLAMELVVVAAFFALDYKRSTWMLNQFLYQDKREEFVQRIQKHPEAGQEQNAMRYIDSLRNYPQQIILNGNEECLQNKRLPDGSFESTVLVRRDCAGNLLLEFVYDADFLGSDYAVLYSDKDPVHETVSTWDVNGIPRTEQRVTIDSYTVLDTLSPHWYYVRCRSPWSGLFNFGGGTAGAGSYGGCP
jgi:hypothetical protein